MPRGARRWHIRHAPERDETLILYFTFLNELVGLMRQYALPARSCVTSL